MKWLLHGGKRKKTAGCLESRQSASFGWVEKGAERRRRLTVFGSCRDQNQAESNKHANKHRRYFVIQGRRNTGCERCIYNSPCLMLFTLRPTKKLIVVVPPACCRPRVLSSGLVCVAKRGKKETQDSWGDEAGVLSIFLSLDFEIFFFLHIDRATVQGWRTRPAGSQKSTPESLHPEDPKHHLWKVAVVPQQTDVTICRSDPDCKTLPDFLL